LIIEIHVSKPEPASLLIFAILSGEHILPILLNGVALALQMMMAIDGLIKTEVDWG
jgi:hypothetical protein